MNQSTVCQICGRTPLVYDQRVGGGKFTFTCDRCGRFTITDQALMGLTGQSMEQRMWLSGALRRASEDGVPLELTTYNIDALLERNGVASDM